MSILPTMEAMYKEQTYSAKQGYKRKQQKVSPSFYYNINREPLTDKQIEFYLLQHKQMSEFLEQKGMTESYIEFQKIKALQRGEFVDWFKKWN